MALLVDQPGHCPICEKGVRFTAEYDWFREHLLCSGCGSVPRERALMCALDLYYPNYRDLRVHESSPGGRGVSVKLHHQCRGYTASHFFPEVTPGEVDPRTGYQCQNLESLLFEDGSFDLVVTQDVMEHIFDPAAAFREIARVLRPGGAHIFTVPIQNKGQPTERRASRGPAGDIVYHHPAEYHGNPIDQTGSLVTMYWGYDIAEFIQTQSGLPSTIVMIDDMSLGIRAEYIEVVVSRKSG